MDVVADARRLVYVARVVDRTQRGEERRIEVPLADVALRSVVLGLGRHEHPQRLVVARVVDDARMRVEEVRHVRDLALRFLDEAGVALGAAVVEPLEREVLEGQDPGGVGRVVGVRRLHVRVDADRVPVGLGDQPHVAVVERAPDLGEVLPRDVVDRLHEHGPAVDLEVAGVPGGVGHDPGGAEPERDRCADP